MREGVLRRFVPTTFVAKPYLVFFFSTSHNCLRNWIALNELANRFHSFEDISWDPCCFTVTALNMNCLRRVILPREHVQANEREDTIERR